MNQKGVPSIIRTFVFEFNATHKLYQGSWSKTKNEAIYGVCSNKNWHGHNFKLFVSLEGELAEDGNLISEESFRAWVQQEILDDLNYKNLSFDSELVRGVPATCEYLVNAIWFKINNHIKTSHPQLKLCHLKLYETKNNSVEYSGDLDYPFMICH